MARRIEDYAVIADTQTAALVGRDGSIDWLCAPRFDSPACFAALLGDEDHGFWRIAPAGGITATARRYRGQTMVLESEFTTAAGTVRVVDCMPPRGGDLDVIRVVEGVEGSVPERIGGVRNWDYRYCSLRDATFTLYAMLTAGYREEAQAWRDWLLRAVAGQPDELQIMYGAAGERRLAETTLGWLPGYEGSAPVRIGNAAVDQFQLDVYGEVMDALHLTRRIGGGPDRAAWALQRALMEFLEGNWTEADEGIWEVRSDRRHFVHSKVMAWVAADRAVKAVEHFGLDGPVDRWRRLRQDIFDEVCAKGWDSQRRTFTQYYGSSELDASLLMIPLVGFLPAGDERMLGTVKAIEAELCIEGVTESIRGELAHQGSHVRIGMVQLPAVNTPQFDWVLSRLPRRAQPVPPIYRPELMARAVVRMAERPRREMWLTGTTIKVIMGNRLAPLYLDRRLGRTGVAAQQTSEPADPDRPSNLWQPVPGDFGAEGAFGDRSRAGDVFAWATLHRPALTAAGLITTAAAAATRLLGRARRPSAPRC